MSDDKIAPVHVSISREQRGTIDAYKEEHPLHEVWLDIDTPCLDGKIWVLFTYEDDTHEYEIDIEGLVLNARHGSVSH